MQTVVKKVILIITLELLFVGFAYMKSDGMASNYSLGS